MVGSTGLEPVAELIKVTEQTAKKSGRDAVYQMLDELMRAGFVIRSKKANGKTDYTVFDKPVTDNQYYGKDVLRENPNPSNPTLVNTENTTSTEKKLVKTEEGDQITFPDWLSESDWGDFVEFRKSIKKPMNDEAKKRVINKLTNLRDDGFDPSEAIDQSIINGWSGLFEIKFKNQKTKSYTDDDIFKGCVNYGYTVCVIFLTVFTWAVISRFRDFNLGIPFSILAILVLVATATAYLQSYSLIFGRIFLFLLLITPGSKGENKYGIPPKKGRIVGLIALIAMIPVAFYL